MTSRDQANALSSSDAALVKQVIKRIQRALNSGARTFAQSILEPEDADSPDKVKDALTTHFEDSWSIDLLPDSRDGNYYKFS